MVGIFLYLRGSIVSVPSNFDYTRGNLYYKFKLPKHTFALLKKKYPTGYI